MPLPLHKAKVAFSVTNSICHDQRVMKMAGVATHLGCDIIIIGRKSDDCYDSYSMPFRTKRFMMIFKKGFLFYAFFNIRFFLFINMTFWYLTISILFFLIFSSQSLRKSLLFMIRMSILRVSRRFKTDPSLNGSGRVLKNQFFHD